MKNQVSLNRFLFGSFRLQIRIRISYSDPDPAKRVGSFRIRIHNTGWFRVQICVPEQQQGRQCRLLQPPGHIQVLSSHPYIGMTVKHFEKIPVAIPSKKRRLISPSFSIKFFVHILNSNAAHYTTTRSYWPYFRTCIDQGTSLSSIVKHLRANQI